MTHIHTCDESAGAMNRASGWAFAHFLNHHFGNETVVLVGGGTNGTDIEFAATNDWLEANHCQNFGITPETGRELHEHVEGCRCPICSKAKERMTMSYHLLKDGMPTRIALASVFESRSRNHRIKFSKENGFSEEIDVLAPFLHWFTDDRDFWLWP